MGQALFLDTSPIRYQVSVIGYKRYFPTPNEPNIKQRMAKLKQTLSKETMILAFNGKGIYIFKTLKNMQELVATSTSNKMGPLS